MANEGLMHYGCVVAENQEIQVIVIKKLHPISDEGAAVLASILLKERIKKEK